MTASTPGTEFIVFGQPDIREDDIAEVVACLRSGWIGSGPRVMELEKAMMSRLGASHAAAVNSCTAALHLSALVAGLGPGDEVITTPMTFCATANAILHAGATPVLADIDPVTLNLDPDEVERRIGPRTRGLLPVHFAGRPCDMDRLAAIAAEHELVMIEDCAHAFDTRYRERAAGTFGDFGCFSFYVTKPLTTAEGGLVLARKKVDIDRVRRLALHGLSSDAWRRFRDVGHYHYLAVEVGFKYNMTDLLASLGLSQLRRAARALERRQDIWRYYLERFADLPLELPAPCPAHVVHGCHLFTIEVDDQRTGMDRDRFMAALHARGIGTGVHYLSLAEHTCYQQRLGWKPADTPQASRLGHRVLSLPLSSALSDMEVERIVESVRELAGGGRGSGLS